MSTNILSISKKPKIAERQKYPYGAFLSDNCKNGLRNLFKFNCRAGFGKFLFHFLSLLFSCIFFYCFGSTVNKIFRFFKAKAGKFANDFNYGDFVCSGAGKNNIEFSFFFRCRLLLPARKPWGPLL